MQRACSFRVSILVASAIAACSGPSSTSVRTDSGPARDTGPADATADTGAPPDAGPDAPPLDPLADRDGDTISDLHESNGLLDTDRDGTPDASDTDSDNDGIPDAEEAGDADLLTLPIDSDGDLTPDFRDPDSDNDGLSDADERMAGTDPRLADTDGDGATDLIESVAMTDPLSATSNPESNGDFIFVVPFGEPPMPPRQTLVFQPLIRKADVYFMIDSSNSMQGDIDGVRSSLIGTIVPGLMAEIPDLQLGTGEFDRCPETLTDANRDTCVGVRNAASSTADVAAVEAALGTMTANCGPTEPYAQAAFLFATNDTTRWDGFLLPTACPPGTFGYGCVREDAVPVLVVIGDEPFGQGNTCWGAGPDLTPAELGAVLAAARVRVVVIGPTYTSAQWGEIAVATGSVDEAGMPFLYASDRAGAIGAEVVTAIRTLTEQATFDLTARARDVDDDGVDATRFIERIEPNAAGGVADPRDATRVCVGGLMTADADMDGFADTFVDVRPGTPVCFDIIARQNDTVMPTAEPQVFRAEIDVLGEGATVLDTREVLFLVPPVVEVMVPD